MISEEKLAEIRNRVPIFELISEFVQLKKTGKNYRGLCPFHQERTPSFFVNPERESFHCFGCGAGGNLFHFLMKMDSLSFPEAVNRLAERAGVAVEITAHADPALQQRRGRNQEIHRQAAWYYHCLLKKLPKDEAVWAYLEKRQVSEESCDAFHLGYCPPQDSGLKQHLLKKGFSQKEIQESSLMKGDREFFRGRLLFPIFRQDNKVVGFGGRLIDDKDFGPKYLNSPESEIFKKGELCYGLHRAKNTIRQKNYVLIAEGYLDVIALHSHGFTEAIAPLGTALTHSQARHLHRLSEEIILSFDGDNAGEQATLRALEILLPEGTIPRIISLESGEDPDSYLKRYGKLAFEKKLKSRRNLLEELIDKGAAVAAKGATTLDEKGRLAGKMLGYIEKIPDIITQKLYTGRLAEALDIPEDWIRAKNRVLRQKDSPSLPPARQHLGLPEEEMILEIWLKHPSFRARIMKELEINGFCTEEVARLAAAFWELGKRETSASTGKYFDLAPSTLIGVLSELTMRSNGLEEESVAEENLNQALLRLKEKRLKLDLQALKASTGPEKIGLIQKKIDDLSQVLKNKERNYGEGKAQ